MSMSDRTAVVTGANTGIGKEAARGLAARGATVILACRDLDKARAAQRDLVASTGSGRIEVLHLDQSDVTSVSSFATELAGRHPAIHVLVNNAGRWPRTRELSKQNIELTWATNVLGYFWVTAALLPLLRAGAPARVINVASDRAYDLDLDDVECASGPFDASTAYAASKQADRMLTWELARRLDGSGVTANAMHPGRVITELFRYQRGLYGLIGKLIFKTSGVDAARGADTIVWLASAPELTDASGKYWYERQERPCAYRDPTACARLWSICESATPASLGALP